MRMVSKLTGTVCLVLSATYPLSQAFTQPAFLSYTPTTPSLPFLRPQSSLCLSSSEPTKSTLVRKPDSAVELTITAPGKATKAAYAKVCAELSKTISIPGFRKGAVIPPAVIENAMAAKGGKNALRTQAIQSLLNSLLEPALKDEHNLEPIGQPNLVTSAETLAESFVPGEALEMVVACDVWPDIQWKDDTGKEKPYYGLEGTYTRQPFDQARFDKAMNDLAERYAVTTPCEDGKELTMGDACVVNMEGYMAAEDGVSKGEALPNAASGDNVEVVLGPGRYMEGLVEGLVGAKVGETRTVYVTFPVGLRDKTLAGKRAVFDVTVNEASIRTVPPIDDELANQIRPGLDAEGIKAELRKAVDDQDAEKYADQRNAALSAALAERMQVDVPDTLVTNQAREKYAGMMADFRGQGMDDDDIKKQITPENFLKYKNIEKPDIVRDFKISMATDEVARLEGIEVPAFEVEEQMENVKKEAAGQDLGDETVLRGKIESTLMRRMVYDFLAEKADLTVKYEEEEQFDEKLMEELAQQSLAREEEDAAKGAVSDSTEGKTNENYAVEQTKVPGEAETETNAMAEADAQEKLEDDAKAKAKAEANANANAKAEAEAKTNTEAEAKAKTETEAKAKAAAEARTKATAETKADVEAEVKIKAIAAEAKAEGEAKAEAKAKVEAEAKAETQAEAKPEAEAEAKSEVEAKAEAEVKAMVEAEAKAKAEAESKFAASREGKMLEAMNQPKSPEKEADLVARYAAIVDDEERAYNILLDLGMIGLSPDPDSPDYDHSRDDEIVL